MTRSLSWLVALVLIAGCGATDPSLESLTGRWRGTVNGLGLGFVTLDLVEDNHTVGGTGAWTAQTGSATGTLTAQGLRFDGEIQLSLDLSTTAGPQLMVLTGRVKGPNSIYLLFPTDPDAKRVSFER